MAGALTISTLNNDTGVLATQNGMTGIAKAWVNYNQVTSTINGSFNVSSVTNNATGDFTINFTTALPNGNYAWSGSTGDGAGVGQSNWLSCPSNTDPTTVMLTTSLRVKNSYANATTNINLPYNGVIVFSS